VAALSRSLDAMGPVDLTVVMGRLTPGTIRKLLEARPDVDLVISTEGPTSPGEHIGPGEREITAGRSGSAVVVMSRISKYGVGELRLDLDSDGRIGAAGIRTTMLDETVPDDPGMRRLLADFYDRMGRDARAQESVPALFPGDSMRAAGRYVGVATCAGCHGSQHEQWRSTPHASAYKTLLDVHRHYNPRCVVCHVVGYGTANGYRLGSPGEELANVQCEVCHGPGGEHASQPNRDNIRKAVDESTCLQCHTPEHSEAFVFADRLPKVLHSPERGAVAMRTGGGSR
jgi:mono/diheme cytochrome c family protein